MNHSVSSEAQSKGEIRHRRDQLGWSNTGRLSAKNPRRLKTELYENQTVERDVSAPTPRTEQSTGTVTSFPTVAPDPSDSQQRQKKIFGRPPSINSVPRRRAPFIVR